MTIQTEFHSWSLMRVVASRASTVLVVYTRDQVTVDYLKITWRLKKKKEEEMQVRYLATPRKL